MIGVVYCRQISRIQAESSNYSVYRICRVFESTASVICSPRCLIHSTLFQNPKAEWWNHLHVHTPENMSAHHRSSILVARVEIRVGGPGQGAYFQGAMHQVQYISPGASVPFGLTMFRLLTHSVSDSLYERLSYFIRYAITSVALLDRPNLQCTSTDPAV